MCCKRVRPLLGRPTSLIRGVRGRVRCDIQIDEAKLHNRALLSSVPNVTTRTSRAAQCNPLEPDHEVDPRARTWLHARVSNEVSVTVHLADSVTMTKVVDAFLHSAWEFRVVDGASFLAADAEDTSD